MIGSENPISEKLSYRNRFVNPVIFFQVLKTVLIRYIIQYKGRIYIYPYHTGGNHGTALIYFSKSKQRN